MKPLIGIDEVGMGCIAGPLAVAAVVFPEGYWIPGLRDSKQMSARKRWQMAGEIRQQALFWTCSFGEPELIDHHGVHEVWRQTALFAANQARQKHPEATIYIDGSITLPLADTFPVIRGDQKFPVISAASVLAKVLRDTYMMGLAKRYPDYLFDVHKGYPTPMHLEAVKQLGPCPAHRRSFRPVQEALGQ